MSVCSGCQATILWCMTVNDKRIPIDPEPCEDGNVELEVLGQSRGQINYRAHVYGPLEAESRKNEGAVLRKPHFATCPQVERFKA